MISPGDNYRALLREAINSSGKSQRQIALDAGLEPSNLSNLLAGRRKPLLDPAKNQALARACGQTPEFVSHIQLAAEAHHGMHNQPQEFRCYMALAVRTLEVLMQQMSVKLPLLQHEQHGGAPDLHVASESLLAAKKMISALKYWWPAEDGDNWDDYRVLVDEFRDFQNQLPPGQQFSTLVRADMEEAMEWARDIGGMDPELEKLDLTKQLARALGIEPDSFQQIIGGLETALLQNAPQVSR